MSRIQLAWPVRANIHEWRNEHGETLAECVAHWLTLQEEMGHFPLMQDAAQAIAEGKWCGVRSQDGSGLALCYLVTPAAITACITDTGLACDTPADLHHVLFDLVQKGYLRKEVEEHALPGLSHRVALYCVSGAIMSLIYRPGAAAPLALTEGRQC